MELLDQFSDKEKAVVGLLIQGKSNKQIALSLGVTPRTIEFHLGNIYAKLGVNSRSEAILIITKSFYETSNRLAVDDLRESTVVSPPEVDDNSEKPKSLRRTPMGKKKFIFTGLGLLVCILVIYFIFPKIREVNSKTLEGTLTPETAAALTPSPSYTQEEVLLDDQLALHVLVDFLESLHNGNYDEAAQLYGGTYETMKDQNPAINPNDHTALLRNACTINGAQCLQVNTAGLDKEVTNKEFVFKVDFLNADETLFVLGPCCGSNETESPPPSIFYLTVVKDDKDKFIVMNMPPYTP